MQRLAESIYNIGEGLFDTMPVGGKERNLGGPSRRGRKIEAIKKEKKALRKQWLNASPAEKPALLSLYEDVKKRLRLLLRQERKKERRKLRKRCHQSFMQNPFKFAKGISQEKRSGILECTKAEMENHLKKTYSDEGRETALPEMSGIPKPSAPGIPYDTRDIKMREVKGFLKKARSKSSPGQDSVPYKVYKKCPKLANRLFLILRKAWREKKVAKGWTTAEGVYIPKEENSATLSQFRPISLLNTDGKIFFGILAKRTMSFLLANEYI